MTSENITGCKIHENDNIFLGHAKDLAALSSSKGCFAFTDFLTPAQRSLIISDEREIGAKISFSGGYKDAERVIARFGSEDELGYSEDFPITLLHISAKNAKFSDELAHRDILGAVLSLGIERRLCGDILTSGSEGWIFVLERIADLIISSLARVKHTSVSVSRADSLPEGLASSGKAVMIIAASVRLDGVIAKVFNLSRKETAKLFSSEKVFVNSRIRTKPEYALKENDLVSVRGFGRFRYIESTGDTRKGNIKLIIEKF